FALLQIAGDVLPALVLGLVLAVSAEPAVAWLVGRGIPRNAAGLMVLVLLVAVGGGAVLLLLPTVVDQLGSVAERAPGICRSLRGWAAARPTRLLATVIQQALPADCGLGAVAGVRWTAARSLGDPLWAMTAVLVGAYAWITERAAIQRGILRLASPERREAGRAVLDEIDARLGAFVRGQAVLSLIIGAATAIFYLIAGVHGALSLGTLAGLLEVVPIAGPMTAAAVGAVAAAGTHPQLVVAVVIYTAAVRIASDYVLTPLVMSRSVGANPLLVLLTLFALGSLGGIMGAMVAVPIAALLQMGLSRLLAAEARVAAPEGRDAVSLLRYRANALGLRARRMGRRRAAVGRDCSAEDEVELLALRTAELLSDGDRMVIGARREAGGAG
ncbi:MAG TPA: AI-2E family transporter, partial [Polyangia bacterium]|nr:AI-2E family transporter [Polyangia bacterium]